MKERIPKIGAIDEVIILVAVTVATILIVLRNQAKRVPIGPVVAVLLSAAAYAFGGPWLAAPVALLLVLIGIANTVAPTRL